MWLKVNAQETRNIKALLDSFPIAQNFSKPANWKEADKDRTFYYSNYPNSMNLKDAIKIIKEEKNFDKFLQAKKWCIDHYLQAIPDLLNLITDTTKVGLENTFDLIIPYRMQTKELTDYGHGGFIFEDIFIVAGRCSYILHELTGEKFALITMPTSKEHLDIYQEIWLNWFWQL